MLRKLVYNSHVKELTKRMPTVTERKSDVRLTNIALPVSTLLNVEDSLQYAALSMRYDSTAMTSVAGDEYVPATMRSSP